jgi:CRP/FNR family transcriptional regulator, cyclic AMP receptor protein
MTSDSTTEPDEVPDAVAPSYLDRLTKTYAEGAVLFDEGAPGREMFIVLKGVVDIHKASGDVQVHLGSFRTGDMFGEMALVEGGVRTGTATIAQDGTELVAVNQSRFVYLVSQQPAFALSVMGMLGRRVEDMNKRLADLTEQRKEGVTP